MISPKLLLFAKVIGISNVLHSSAIKSELLKNTCCLVSSVPPRYSPNAALPFATSPIISPVGFEDGNEWEIRTYIHINIGK